ncbi:MAG: LpxI family protein [Elsteraceae bacterium]
MTQPAPLGILAGGGAMPRRIIRAQAASGRSCFVVAFENQADRETAAAAPHVWVKFGDAGLIMSSLREAGVKEVVMAGRFVRPSLMDIRPDGRAAMALLRIGLGFMGDDGLLRNLAAEFERDGFQIVAIQTVLPEALAPEGCWTEAKPSEHDALDIQRGVAVASALGAVDVGQGAIVQQGLVLTVEAIEGTDAMIDRAKTLRRPGGGGVLVKLAKPGQDDRLDLPTIGPVTLRNARDAGLVGIAVEAGRSLIVDRETVIAEANAAGLFVVGFPRIDR